MSTKFGILAKLDFLQSLASKMIAGINPAVIHNIEKYLMLKKVHYLSAIEEIEGDYLEFGVYTGSSFCHSIRCCLSMAKRLNPDYNKTQFWGFDSFDGFGELDEAEKHPFYTDQNFATSYSRVNKRCVAAAKSKVNFKLIQGFFEDSLSGGAKKYSIEKARIIFIDSDTYSSASEALKFCRPIVQLGTFIILDDYFSYKGSTKNGVKKAFDEFVKNGNFSIRKVFDYGMGGVVYLICE